MAWARVGLWHGVRMRTNAKTILEANAFVRAKKMTHFGGNNICVPLSFFCSCFVLIRRASEKGSEKKKEKTGGKPRIHESL